MKPMVSKWIPRAIVIVLAGFLFAACLPVSGISPVPGTVTPALISPGEATAVQNGAQEESLSSALTPPPDATPQDTPTPQPTFTPPAPASPLPPPYFGVETHQINRSIAGRLQDAGVTLLRRNGVRWADIEPEEGLRRWENMLSLERNLRRTGNLGLPIILVVRYTPAWAQKIPGSFCGPISQEKFGAFARFMQDLVARYSVPPYNVRYWELGNEPDVDPSLVDPQGPFGCWGDPGDDYYGGGYYAEMLKVVYPAIKAVDPQAQVLIGGLLMDCDPGYPPAGQDCKSSRFLEGILRNGGGDSFDIVSFHGYPFYDGSLKQDEQYQNWKYRGGVVMGKATYIREVLAQYGFSKPLIHTEGGMLCPEWLGSACNPPGEDFFEAQADYVVRLYVRNWAHGISGTIWYTLDGPGWRNGGMLDQSGKPRPVYRAFRFLTKTLGGASYTLPLDRYPGIRGYQFEAPQKTIWVLWSEDEQTRPIPLPQGVINIYDKYGNSILPSTSELPIDSPVYVEFGP